MSKRILASALVVGALAASNAFASQARQLVLGTQDPLNVISSGTHGSLLVDDNMNIFYNPSYANDYKNWASVEKASGYAGAASQAEGGFINNFGPVTAGIYLNRQDAVNTLTTGAFNSAPVRPFDLFVAGDMGVKWGLKVSQASRKTAPNTTESRDLGSNVWSATAGVQVMDFEPFVSYQLTGKDKAAGATAAEIVEDQFKSFSIGTRYKFGEWVPFAVYRSDKFQDASAAPATTQEYTATAWGLGFGRNTKVAEGSTLNYGAAYWSRTAPVSIVTKSRSTQKVLPLNVSFESDATTWLTLRAGIAYSLLDQSNGLTNASATTGRIGAGLKFGKAVMDFAVGNGGVGVANVDTTVFDFSNGLFSVASLTYNW